MALSCAMRAPFPRGHPKAMDVRYFRAARLDPTPLLIHEESIA
jgi:hypothetical protein